MPQAKTPGEGSTQGDGGQAKPRATRARTTKAAASKSTASKSASKSTAAKSASTRSRATGKAAAAKPRSSSARAKSVPAAEKVTAKAKDEAKAVRDAADARFELVARRLRALNERIIDAGRDAGESTLSSYEKALKAIASGIEKGPGRSDIDWISQVATAQAKFIRDLTDTWAKAAREMLK